MRSLSIPSVATVILSVPVLAAQSCAPAPTDNGNGSGTGNGGGGDLTAAELNAIDAASDGIQVVARGGNIVQNGPGAVDDASAQAIPTLPDEFSVGTCPVTTLIRTTLGSTSFNVTLDFGAGCALFGQEDLTCVGSLSGTLDLIDSDLNLNFNSLTCGQDVLEGTASVSYSPTDTTVTMTGQWDLAESDMDGGNTVSADGSGTAVHDRNTNVLTVSDFSGTVTGADQSVWSVTAAAVTASYVDHGTYIPFGGTLTVSGSGIRTVTIQFDANSPATGQVQATIDGGPTVTVDLNTI